MRPGKAGNSKLPASFSMSCSPRFCSKATSGTCRAARICSRVQRGDGSAEDGSVIVFPPMRLNEDVIDLLEINDAGLVAHRFNEGAQAKVAGAAQKPFAGADDQREGFGREGIVTQTGAIHLAQDELFDGFWTQARQH